MKDYIVKDPWKIIEDNFHPEYNEITESLCSLGNGKMGLRGNFAEDYSGKTLQGTYFAGIYYPDKTKVGWWKNGYPEYFAKVLNACNWIGLHIKVNGQPLNLSEVKIHAFSRTLNMKEGILYRDCSVEMNDGVRLNISTERFCHLKEDHLAAMKYSIKCISGDANIELSSYLDFDIKNKDSNYDEKFWTESQVTQSGKQLYNEATTKKTLFTCGVMASNHLSLNNTTLPSNGISIREKYIEEHFTFNLNSGDSFKLVKTIATSNTLYEEKAAIKNVCSQELSKALDIGYESLKNSHKVAWLHKWEESDIQLKNDIAAQQGIRFNIFHLHQTYTGRDDRLNIGPKGFTGEKYGGSTYWDTEAYCLPFYLSTAKQSVARNLLIYRHKHLAKAIENASSLGFTNGAALYPMVTMDGTECHNEWEITFEEIHRNGAIAYAIFDYIRYTGDTNYLETYGLDVLIGIARFWKQRVSYSQAKEKYVILGVTGPNEYENNVNNNWYTNYIASWCLKYCFDSLKKLKESSPKGYHKVVEKNKLNTSELTTWEEVANGMYYPMDEVQQIILQQEGYLDKEQILVKDLDKQHLPLNQKWSWDRILRSCFIKQADVLQGLYFFEEDFDLETIKRNFDFYEPRTVHESSLSPCVHVILACLLGKKEKAYEMYLRTARLDIDDYNNDTEDGLHITSMAGTWMSIVKGFGGMRIKNELLSFSPLLPDNWESLSFNIRHRTSLLNITIEQNQISLENRSDSEITILINEEQIKLGNNETKTCQLTLT